MASRHGERTEENRAAPAEDTVGEKTAEDRREINAGGVGAEDGGGERLAVEPAVKFSETVEGHDVLDPARVEEIVDHVKGEQRLHTVVGKTFPSFGEGEIPEPAGMAEEIRGVFFAGQRRGVFGFGGGGHGGDGEASSDK